MTVSKASPKRIRISVSVSVNSQQFCITETRPTMSINFGSSQNINAEQESFIRKRKKVRSCSPPKSVDNASQHVPHIVVSGVEDVKEEWETMAKEIEESTFKAKQREKKKKARKARVGKVAI